MQDSVHGIDGLYTLMNKDTKKETKAAILSLNKFPLAQIRLFFLEKHLF